MSTPLSITYVRFVEEVLGVILTRGQRVFSLVAFDGLNPCDLEGEDREIARLIFGGLERLNAHARRTIAAVFGRGSGKTMLASYRALHVLLTADAGSLAPGEAGFALVIAPDKATARQFVRFALGIAKSVPSIARLVTAEGADGFTIRRPDGKTGVLEAIACSRGGAALRGRTLWFVALDESGFFMGEDSVRNDLDVFRAALPRIAKGGQIILLSTPWVDGGLLFDLYSANFGDSKTALACLAPTLVMRDNDPEIVAMVAQERARDADNAAREFDCSWRVSGSSVFFDPTLIDRCIDPELTLPGAPIPGALIYPGGDLGFRQDSSAITIVQRPPGAGRGLVLSALDEIRPSKDAPLVPSVVCARWAASLRPYGARQITLDGHYIESAREHLTAHNVGVILCPGGATGKVEAHLAAREVIHGGHVRIPEHPRLIAQLKAITAKPLPGGTIAISSPRRAGVQGHGDLASAFVLSLWLANQEWIASAQAAAYNAKLRGIYQSLAMNNHFGPDEERKARNQYAAENGSIYAQIRRASGNPIVGGKSE